MTSVELSRTVLHAVRRAVDAGELSVVVPARAMVTVPGAGGAGDYATNIALQLARPAGQTPLRVAELLRTYLAHSDGIADVEITGPGFLNISLDRCALSASFATLVERIRREGRMYGHSDHLDGRVLDLRVPHGDVRVEVLAGVLGGIVRSQGGRLVVRTGGSGNALYVRSAAEDPAFLGVDASRWALIHSAPHDLPHVSVELLVQRESNPLFRVRYAHARTRAVGRNAADIGFGEEPGVGAGVGDGDGHFCDLLGGFHGPHELRDLLDLLGDYPRVLATVGTLPSPDAVAAPSRLARYLVGLADATLPLLPGVLPSGAEKPSAAHRARLALAEAAGTVLAGGLSLLGIDAPDHL